MNQKNFVDTIHELGGRVFLVGGYVRDLIRQVKPKDRDYCLTGVDESSFTATFPTAERIGKSFPVYLLTIDNEKCEVAFARREKKSGHGYKGFQAFFDKTVTIEDDLYRRDSTMNSIALELPAEKFIDPFNGIADIHNKKIRAVSEHFLEDPVRALRAARQSAELQFEITAETVELMKKCRDEIQAEPAERILNELMRAIKSDRPSIFFRSLLTADLLAATFPEVFDLVGKIQPTAFHPEGDAFEHSMQILDKIAEFTPNIEIRFAALCHDLGKGTTPTEMLPHHYMHEVRGLEVLQRWNDRMTLPKHFLDTAKFVIKEHMRVPMMQKPGKIVNFLLSLQKSKINVRDFSEVIRIDNHGTIPFFLEHYDEIMELFSTVRGKDAPKNLQGEEVGKWLLHKKVLLYIDFKNSWERVNGL